VEEFREAVRKSLEAETIEEYDASYFNQVLDKIKAQAQFKYPPQAIDDEAHQVLHNIEADLARQKMDFPTYLKLRKMEQDAFIEQEVRPAAIRRLERSLLLNEISKKEEIKLDDKLFQSQYYQTLTEVQGQVDLEQLKKKSNERMANAIAMEAVNRTMNRQVLARLKKIAGGIEEASEAVGEAVTEAPAESPAESAPEPVAEEAIAKKPARAPRKKKE
jgi:trigger factor